LHLNNIRENTLITIEQYLARHSR